MLTIRWYDNVVYHFIIIFIFDVGHLLVCYLRGIIIDQVIKIFYYYFLTNRLQFFEVQQDDRLKINQLYMI